MVTRRSLISTNATILLSAASCFALSAPMQRRQRFLIASSVTSYQPYDAIVINDDDINDDSTSAENGLRGGLSSVLSPPVTMLVFALVFFCLFGTGVCLLRCAAQESEKEQAKKKNQGDGRRHSSKGGDASGSLHFSTSGGHNSHSNNNTHHSSSCHQFGPHHSMAQLQGSMSTSQQMGDTTGHTHDETTLTGGGTTSLSSPQPHQHRQQQNRMYL